MIERETEKLLKSLMGSNNIKEYIKKNEQSFEDCSFSECLNRLLSEKNLKRSDILNRVNIGKSYLYELFDGTRENPSRDVIVQLCFGLDLRLKEANLLLRAGNCSAFDYNYKRDFVIIYSLYKEYGIIKCNELLDDFGEALIV